MAWRFRESIIFYKEDPKMKKLLALLLCAAMVVSLVACAKVTDTDAATTTAATTTQTTTKESTAKESTAKESTAKESTTKESTTKESTTAPPVDEIPVLKVGYIPDSNVTDLDDNDLTYYYEDLVGIEIEWVELPADLNDAISKMNMWIVDGTTDICDVLIGLGLGKTAKEWGDAGFLLNWSTHTDLMPNWCAIPEEYLEQAYSEITNADGTIYSLPSLNLNYWNSGYFRYRMNVAWLDALKLDVPTTTDELKDVRIAFRDNDPNGNGLKDEIPMTGMAGNDTYGSNTLYMLMNCFIYFDGFIRNTGLSLDAETGTKVIAPYATAEWQEGLRYLKSLWDENLISSSYFTHTYDTLTAEMNTGVDLVGVLCNGSNGIYQDRKSGNNIAWNNMTMVQMPVGPKGFVYSIHNPQIAWDYAYVLADGNWELGLKFIDAMYTEEATYWANIGRYGIDWTDDPAVLAKASNGLIEAGVFDKSVLVGASLQSIWDEPNNWHWWGVGACMYPMDDNVIFGSTNPEAWDVYKGLNWKYNRNFYEHEIPTLTYTDDEYKQISDAIVYIPDYVMECFAGFVTGTMDIDADWDEYIGTMNDMGLETLISISQTAFDRVS
jgi:putative aldouronate transport system substrate-binding protein